MRSSPPSTTEPNVLVLQHYKENRRKCSLEPLRGRSDVEFRRIFPEYPNPDLVVDGGIVLAVDSPVLDPRDRVVFDRARDARVIVVDGTWTKIQSVVANIVPSRDDAPLIFRSLPEGIVTAYPRRSKLREDPEEGLASIEALVAALHVLGRDWEGLLDGYRWADAFLDANRELFTGHSESSRPR